MTEQQQLIPLSVGERLREARKKQGLDLLEIALQLRIDEPVMRAIEADKLGHLAPVYQRGYVTAYARHLKFKESELEQLLDQLNNEQPKLHAVFPEAGNPNQADRWLKATSYVLASLLVGTLAWQFAHEAVRLSHNGAGPDSASEIPLSNQQQPDIRTPVRDTDSATHVNASIAALEVQRQARTVRNNGGAQAWAALQQPSSDADAVKALPVGEYILDLTASGDSWVEISDANGQQLELDLIRGGTHKQYRGTAPFSIQFGRASALSLYLDGQPVDLAPFTTGNVTQMTLSGPGQE